MDKISDLENMRWSSNSAPTKGPKRLCKFCILGVILPIIFLCVPLYMRYQALRPHFFTLSPSDMKLLNQESKVSTVWCEGQELRMNGTFNAYLLPERPRLRRYRQHVTMNRKMMMRDDIKEYWGFYLLRGSYVHLSVCSRHEGASFIIVKGLEDARRCSFLGELDSAEESDEISEEFEFSHELIADSIPEELLHKEDSAKTHVKNVTESQEVVREFLHSFHSMDTRHKQVLVKRLLEALDEDPTSEEMLMHDQKIAKFIAIQLQEHEKIKMTERKVTTERSVQQSTVDYDDDIGGGEQDDDDVYDMQHRGTFLQQNPNDQSNEETHSSYSSSEEALAACEGLLFNVPLNGGTQCTPEASESSLAKARTEVTLEVTETGFYYFIFANENEITDNFMSAKFDLHKTVFDVSGQQQNCTGSTECKLPLSFWSHDHVVLEVPDIPQDEWDNSNSNTNGTDPCHDSLLMGFSSLAECHRVIMAESICTPRKPLYAVFFILVPVLILFCAHF